MVRGTLKACPFIGHVLAVVVQYPIGKKTPQEEKYSNVVTWPLTITEAPHEQGQSKRSLYSNFTSIVGAHRKKSPGFKKRLR
jgi:hypothetical protein